MISIQHKLFSNSYNLYTTYILKECLFLTNAWKSFNERDITKISILQCPWNNKATTTNRDSRMIHLQLVKNVNQV